MENGRSTVGRQMAFHQLLRRELGIGQKGRGGYETGGQLSLLLDATGYRAMLRNSWGETAEWRLENTQELIESAGGFHTAASCSITRRCPPVARTRTRRNGCRGCG